MDVTNAGRKRIPNLVLNTLQANNLIGPISNVSATTGSVSLNNTNPVNVVTLDAATPTTITLADPLNPSDNGKIITFVATTAQAHIVNAVASHLIDNTGAAKTTATFNNGGAAIGLNMTVQAAAGKWYVTAERGITFS